MRTKASLITFTGRSGPSDGWRVGCRTAHRAV